MLHPQENFNGVDTAHYRNYEVTQKKLGGSTLYMPTEFLHGLYDGGLGAGLDDYWKAMYASPLGAGGFLWVLVDEGVVRTDQNGQLDVAGNQAPDGIVGPYRQKEASFYTIKEIWSPVHIDLEKLPEDFDGTIKIENRYDFTNLRECTFEVKLANSPVSRRQGRRAQDGLSAYLSRSGPPTARHGFAASRPAPDLAPGGCPVPDGLRSRPPGALDLVVGPSGNQAVRGPSACRREAGGRFETRQTADRIHVSVGELGLALDRGSGALVRVARGRPGDRLRHGPRLIGGEGRVNGTTVRRSEDGRSVQVGFKYDGDMRQATWTIYPTGWISLDYEYELNGQFDIFGIGFDYPESKMQIDAVPRPRAFPCLEEPAQGRHARTFWSNKYKNDIPGVTWDFPEFKGYYRDWRWVVFSTEQGDITIVNGTPELFLGVYRPNDGPVPANTKLNVPETGIAFLHGIPAIGTKFDKPEVLGPQSQKNKASGTYRGTVWFHFGD